MTAAATRVDAYLTLKKKNLGPDTAKLFAELEELYNKKLWYQVSQKIVLLAKQDDMIKGTELVDLYANVVAELENRVNPLFLTEFADEVIKQMPDADEAIKFIEKLLPKVVNNQEAKVLCNVLIAQVVLYRIKDQVRTKKILEETEQFLDDIGAVTPIHGRFYLLLSELYCQSSDHANYYRAALHYLGCIDLSTLDEEDKKKKAFFLGLAALLGKGIYNFGELLSHPILDSLKGTDNEWLKDVLVAFNQGDLSTFEANKPMWTTQPDLVAKESQIREKIILLCLMEMTFKRKAWDRQLKFSEISKETRLPEDQVEMMVMRALSLGLVKGTIDQVDQKVNITWVQPRVLDKKQLASMMGRLGDWCQDVNSMQKLLEDQANSILTL